MDVKTVVPSLSNLSHFADARARGLTSPVAGHRRQAEAPKEGRFPSFYYESLLSGVIAFVAAGLKGPALRDTIERATDSKKASYRACAEGLAKALDQVKPSLAARGKRVQVEIGGQPVVRVRIHLVLVEQAGRRVLCYLHFSGDRLTATELAMVETSIALASRQISHHGPVAIISARSGELRYVNVDSATAANRVTALQAESDAYRTEWETPE
jgi:hypothetical protein